MGRHKEALKCYTKALELDPTLWVAFEKLCKLSGQLRPEDCFPDSHVVVSRINALISSKDYFNNTDSPLSSLRISKETVPHRPETARILTLKSYTISRSTSPQAGEHGEQGWATCRTATSGG